jgi:hypothetical protein
VLADYLRSGKPLTYYTIDAIAAWMAGELPPKRGRGRPHGTPIERAERAVGMRLLEMLYRWRYEQAGRPSGKADEFVELVAKERGIDPEKLRNYIRRSKKQRHKRSKRPPPLEEMYWEWKKYQKRKKRARKGKETNIK